MDVGLKCSSLKVEFEVRRTGGDTPPTNYKARKNIPRKFSTVRAENAQGMFLRVPALFVVGVLLGLSLG